MVASTVRMGRYATVLIQNCERLTLKNRNLHSLTPPDWGAPMNNPRNNLKNSGEISKYLARFTFAMMQPFLAAFLLLTAHT